MAGIGRDELLRTGWRQGSLLAAEAGLAASAWIVESAQALPKAAKAAAQRAHQGGAFPFLWNRPMKATDRLVLVTQQCDVIKSPTEFPFAEFALALETANAGVLGEAKMLTSARYFLLTPRDAVPGTVLDVRYRCQVDKAVLLEYPADNSLVEALGRAGERHLAEWLGRRYEREAVSDLDTEKIVEPVRSAWRTLSETDLGTATRWAEVLAELRYTRDDEGQLTLYGVAYAADGYTESVLEVLEWVREQLGDDQDPDLVATSLWELSVGERLMTYEIDLEWASYEEGA